MVACSMMHFSEFGEMDTQEWLGLGGNSEPCEFKDYFDHVLDQNRT